MTTSIVPAKAFEKLDVFGFRLTMTGLHVVGPAPSFDQWQHLGEYLRFMEGAVQWLIGDWIRHGETNYGEMMSQAIDATGVDESTVRQYAWVADRVEPQTRVPALTFSHHREVAALHPAEQKAWLSKALNGDEGQPWSVKRLHREVATSKTGMVEAPTFWLLVACNSEQDRETLATALASNGRQTKVP